ncbi:MAG: hypothetical protein JXA41_02490 [Deltaproteobacteria bacterium]|nr:hypothetical protein [Deltaproteobacteria bacterium]
MESGVGKRLRNILESVVPKDHIELYSTMDDLFERFQNPICHGKVTVIFAATRKDFHRILPLKDFLSDMNLVLILPDDSPEMMAEAHTLRPRYITWADSDFRDIEAVLKRLMALSKNCF